MPNDSKDVGAGADEVSTSASGTSLCFEPASLAGDELRDVDASDGEGIFEMALGNSNSKHSLHLICATNE